jgi:shikimate kinase
VHLVLFGFKSSGKSHLGKLVAHKLRWPFIDTDSLLVEEYRKKMGVLLSVSEIYSQLGETDFRLLEAQAVYQIQDFPSTVIAVGGGTFLNRELAHFLAKIGTLIYLKADFSVIQERILSQKLPSFVDPEDPKGSLLKLYKKRKTLYASIGGKQIQIDGLSDRVLVEQIIVYK